MRSFFCVAAISLLLLPAAVPCLAQLICSGDIPPRGTVITATGTSSICGGACRARKFEPLQGTTMIICAEQPIPKNYNLESLTSNPSCACLGEQENAYVIRLKASAFSAGLGEADSGEPDSDEPDSREAASEPLRSGLPSQSPVRSSILRGPISSGGARKEPFQVGD